LTITKAQYTPAGPRE